MSPALVLSGAVVIALSRASFAAPELELPIACEIGRTCFIQNYVEHKTPDGTRDYLCGSRTYRSHNGTDFRVPDMQAQRRGVNVLAAAAGTLTRLRDGIDDISVRGSSPDAVKNVECGNGVIIAHGDGWETQYCHMEKGSLSVRAGQKVIVGQVLGRVGLSGLTEYPHLHFTVRHNQKIIDPFAYDLPEDRCGEGRSLWSATTALVYRASEILNSGFVSRSITTADIEAGIPPLGDDPPVLAAFVRAIGLKQGDIQKFMLKGPNDEVLAAHDDKPLDSDRAEQFLLVGKNRPSGGWPPGAYVAQYAVERGGGIALRTEFSHRF